MPPDSGITLHSLQKILETKKVYLIFAEIKLYGVAAPGQESTSSDFWPEYFSASQKIPARWLWVPYGIKGLIHVEFL